MEQIVKTAGPTETKYTDVSEDARGAGMSKLAWVRQGGSGMWLATRYWAGQASTEVREHRLDAEAYIERTIEHPSLIIRIAVS